MKTQLGFLKHGDIFEFDGRKYKAGHAVDGTSGYVACTDIKTHKVTRFYIDTYVEVER